MKLKDLKDMIKFAEELVPCGFYKQESQILEVTGHGINVHTKETIVYYVELGSNIPYARNVDDWVSNFVWKPTQICTTDDINKIRESVKTVKRKIEEENKHHKNFLEEINNDLREVQSKCPHINAKYHPDASGGSDHFTECLDCGLELM